MFLAKKKSMEMVSYETALVGRSQALEIEPGHFVLDFHLKGPFPAQSQTIYFAMGCFWGAERLFWPLEGVLVSAVGYQGGFTPNPTYEEVCSGKTGHAETVMVVFDPLTITLNELLKIFWENHDPTQGMAQGNDLGTQYRSAIYTDNEEQVKIVDASHQLYSGALRADRGGVITTQISPAKLFYYAETSHQQYLAKNPGGYCGLAGTGVSCPNR